MSTIFYNLITVTGPRPALESFRADAERTVAGALAKAIGSTTVDWSFEKLLELHPTLADLWADPPPSDEWIYFPAVDEVRRWSRGFQARYRVELKNYQIHEMIRPLSRFYPALCFVNSELCLDDGTVLCAYARRGRGAQWDLPEHRSDAHWRRAARAHGVKDLEEAYDDDDIRYDAEIGMVREALSHWNDQIRRALTPRPAKRRARAGSRARRARGGPAADHAHPPRSSDRVTWSAAHHGAA